MIQPNNLDDIDGDVNHFGNLYPDLDNESRSRYYDIDSFNADCRKGKSDLALLHLNVRSLYSKLDNLISYITLLNIDFDVICLSEVWLNPSTAKLINISNYRMFSKLRCDRVGGGGGG